MATGVNVKLGVSGVNDFKRGMKDAETSVKTLESALKLNDAAMKESGNSEQYLKNKTDILKDAIQKQTEAVQQAQRALEVMRRDGVDESSSAFQKMQKSAYDAQTKLTEMKSSLKGVEDGAPKANEGLKKIGQGIDWQNVTTGLDSIIDKLESGARAAVNLGKKILGSVKESTEWADELLTTSMQTGIDVVTLQQMDKLAHIVEVDTDAIVTAKNRMAKATQTQNGVKSIEEILGIELNGQSADDLFWEIGDALSNMGEQFDKEYAAQQIFGRGWHELLPLFKTGREQYEKMLSEQTYLTEDQVKSLGEADDAIKSMELQIQQLKNEFWSEHAGKITELMDWLVKNKEEVVGAVTAIAGAFGLLKLGSLALNLGKVVTGLKGLGLAGGGSSLLGGVPAASAAGQAVSAGTGLSAKIANLMTSNAGLAATAALLGIPMIDKFFNGDTRTADEIEKDMMRTIGGQNVVDIYEKIQQQGLARRKIDNPDWRPSYMQDQSYYNGPGKGSEVVHKDRRGQTTFDDYSASLDRMIAATETASASEIQANSEMTAAIGNLEGLPAAVAAAVQAGMSNVTIVIGEGAVGAIGRRISGSMARNVVAMTK